MNKLVDVLRNIESFEWSKALFLPEDEIWGIDTKCMILDPNDVEDEDDEAPQIALENGLSYALDVQSIQAIVQNISEQKKILQMRICWKPFCIIMIMTHILSCNR